MVFYPPTRNADHGSDTDLDSEGQNSQNKKTTTEV